jgi:CubicO group peptidase (beta-lactamase class C family)
MRGFNRSQFSVLYHDSLSRMIDLEILSAHAQGDASTLMGQFVSLLVFVSLILSGAGWIYGSVRMGAQEVLLLGWSGEHLLIATTMLVVGLFAVLSWDSTFPDRRDVLVLAPLPVRARTVFGAKVAAVAMALCLTIVTLNVAAGIAWPLALTYRSGPAQTTLSFTTDPAIAPVNAEDMQALLDHEMEQAQVLKTGFLSPGTNAGVTIGVVKHGVRRVFAYGSARPDSVFEIGSISKTFTALLLARMVKEGTLKLDEPVRELFPPGVVRDSGGRDITLADLATHRSGLPRMPRDFFAADRSGIHHLSDLHRFLAKYGLTKPEHASFNYSNFGFGLLGQALAARSGKSYQELLQEQITGPLGMRDTAIELTPELRKRYMQGYDGDRHPTRPFDQDVMASAGGIRSTAGDLLTYLEAQLHPEKAGELSSALQFSHDLRAEIAPGVGIGLSWFYNLLPGCRCYWHGGSTPGFTSDAFFKAKDDYAAVVLVNSGPNALGFADWLSEHVRQRLAGEPAYSLTTLTIPARRGWWGFIRLFFAYWVTILVSGAFIFCSVLGLQGMAAQLLPRRLFLRVSSFLQLASFCIFVSVYFLQPKISGAHQLTDAQGSGMLSWSPSYWFLGLFQQLSGSPLMAPLAKRAWIGLAIALSVTAIAYALAYFRTLRKIIEEPDILPGSRGVRWLPPFGDSLQTAVVQFAVRTLMRSRQHRIVLAFYLGIGFAATIFLMKPPNTEAELALLSSASSWREVSVPLLASSLIMLGFWIVGNRVVYSLPLDLGANWIFRVTPIQAGPSCLAARRRALWAMALVPYLAVAAALFLSIWPWRVAAGHIAVLALIGAFVAEVCLGSSQKIPFTCSWLPGKSRFYVTFWFAILLVIVIVSEGAQFELRTFADPLLFYKTIAILCLAAAAARLRTTLAAKFDEEPVQFEDAPVWRIVTLDLPPDGGLPG